MIALGPFTAFIHPQDPDLILLNKDNSPVNQVAVRISAARMFLVGFDRAQYTVNAAIRIARFVAKELGMEYKVPNTLNGDASDEKLIIPDQIVFGVVLLQAINGLQVDGLPGADFIRRVMKLHRDVIHPAHCRAAFMNEQENDNVLTPDGRKIVLPDFKAPENVVYDFLRDITQARNGLWSIKPDVVNLTGFRRAKGNTEIKWDDFICASWIGPDGRKHAKVYTATTEPGNREKFKTLLPQTILFVPGYHQGKIPAMRGHRTVTFVPTNLFPERFLFNTNDDRGLNLHPGGTTGALKGLVKGIFPTAAHTKEELQAVLIFMEIFGIISRWGLNPDKPALDNLAEWAAIRALQPGQRQGDLLPLLQDESPSPVKQISIKKARGWMAKKWSNNRPALMRILKSTEQGFTPPANFNALNTKGLEGLIKVGHIQSIVQKQCDYFLDPKEVDGMAGERYLNLLNAELPPQGALAQQANLDFARIKELFGRFDGSNEVLNEETKAYVQQIRAQTLLERARLAEALNAQGLETSGQQVDELVDNWSILCQVVFGPEMFYEMMHFALQHAKATGQRYWYYTLIDMAGVPKS